MLKFLYIEPLIAAGLDPPFNNQTISASKRCFQMDKRSQCDWLQVILAPYQPQTHPLKYMITVFS